MIVRHPPPDELLLGYAAGGLPEPLALLVSSHLALCPASRAEMARWEAVGGILLADEPPVPISAAGRRRLLAGLDDALSPSPAGPAGDPRLPAPLRPCAPDGLDRLPWKRIGGVSIAELSIDRRDFTTRLLRAAPGQAIPRHTHLGGEWTLVLDGGFSDGHDRYRVGDVCAADAAVTHRPVADPDGPCLCLIVADAPIRLTGLLGRLLNPFIRS
jgi:putative transcriptional regulator